MCPVCKYKLPDYPDKAGSCTCGNCSWLYLDQSGWYGEWKKKPIDVPLKKKKRKS